MSACSCGEVTRHVVCTRQTIDGQTVQLWSDGTFGSRFSAIPGLPHRARKATDMEALWRFMDCVCLLLRDELSEAFDEATSAAPLKRAQHKLQWEVTRADWTGRATERRADVPRLMFGGGYVIYDEPSRRPRYSLWHLERGVSGFYSSGHKYDSACLVHGSDFVRLADLFAHLEAERAANEVVP